MYLIVKARKLQRINIGNFALKEGGRYGIMLAQTNATGHSKRHYPMQQYGTEFIENSESSGSSWGRLDDNDQVVPVHHIQSIVQ